MKNKVKHRGTQTRFHTKHIEMDPTYEIQISHNSFKSSIHFNKKPSDSLDYNIDICCSIKTRHCSS